MKDQGFKKVERILFIVLLALGIIAIAGVIIMIGLEEPSVQNQEPIAQDEEITEYEWEDGLSDSTVWLPENCKIYSKVPEFSYKDEQDKLHSVTELEGKPAVIVFWASWCEDCEEQMPLMNSYSRLEEKYGELQFVYINKTDGEKETKEAAVNYFKEQGIEGETFFDENLKACEILGIRNIPTTLFLDAEGIITAWSSKPVTSITQFEALLVKALQGGSYATADFIINQLMDERGAVYTTYAATAKEEMAGSDILSESEGAMLEYSVESGNQELFDTILGYIQTYMLGDELTAWTVSGEEASKVNALIDDLRIYEAIYQADEMWSGYDEVLADYQSRLTRYGLKDQLFVDFYDAESKAYAKRFTLCYGDLKTMKLLAQKDSAFEAAYKGAAEVMKNGQISDKFPLYYSWYNYEKEKYEVTDLNTAEAMVTLLHLAEADLLPDNTLSWLKTQMDHGGVKARYSVKGEIISDYNYDSTAVYALIAMIGAEAEDDMLVSQAVKKMEKMRIDDTSLAIDGAFGLEDGTGIVSFDQMMPLLAYMRIYGK